MHVELTYGQKMLRETYVEKGECSVGRARVDENALRRVADGERQRQR